MSLYSKVDCSRTRLQYTQLNATQEHVSVANQSSYQSGSKCLTRVQIVSVQAQPVRYPIQSGHNPPKRHFQPDGVDL